MDAPGEAVLPVTDAGSDPVAAPPAPGRLGAALDPQAAMAYLDAMGRWIDGRRRELDSLDRAALAAPSGAASTGDIALSMAVWKAVADRYALLLATWDSGRVGTVERERLAALIWGRLDAGAVAGLAVSLPEACRMSDALAGQLRSRLSLDGGGLEIVERLRQLRATVERLRDQVTLEPAGAARDAAAHRQVELDRRVRSVADKAGRGGDVGGLLGPLEAEAALFERDLIVGGSRRRETGAQRERVRRRQAELEARQTALEGIARRCVETVLPAPKYAVPDVSALGPAPEDPAGLDTYERRLGQVDRALALAESAYLQSLRSRDDLLVRLDAYRVKAEAIGVQDDPELARAYALARDAVEARPTRITIATQLVDLVESYLQFAGPSSATTGGGRP